MSDQPELSGKLGLDVTDFKTAVSQFNRDLRVIESGFRASAASLGNWGKTADGLNMRMDALGRAMEVQGRKAQALKAEYERVKKEKGENSRAAQELLIKLNKENETLGKMQAELNQTQTALDDMGKESDQAGKEVEELGKKEEETNQKGLDWHAGLGVLSGGLAAVGKGAVALLAGVAALAAGIGALVVKSADMAGELVDMSNQTGIGVERLQEMKYVGEQTGTSLETMTGGMAKLTRNMATAQEQQQKFNDELAAGKMEDEIGTPIEMAEAFNRLGVSFTDNAGKLRDNEVVFQEVITALGKIPNETERDALAMQIFGKSAQELNPLIKAGADEINRLTDEAHKVGAVVDEETVGSLEGFGDQLASLKSGLTGTLATLAGSFLPGLGNLATQAQGYLGKFTEIVTSSKGDLGAMAPQLGTLLGTLIQDAVKQIPGLLTAGLSMIQSLLTGIVTSLPQLLPGVIGIINQLVQFLIQSLPLLMQAGIQIVMALVQGIGPALPGLIESAIQMIVTLATGLSEALPQLIPAIAEIIPQVIITLIENLPLLIDAAMQLIVALVGGLGAALPILVRYIPQIVTAIKEAIITALPLLAAGAVKIVTSLVDGITENQYKLGEKAKGLIENIGTVITGLLPQLVAMGGQIVAGVWKGISAKAASFAADVKKFFSGIVDSVKGALGIKSPSEVFASIGENMALGLGEGFAEAFKGVGQRIAGATMPGLPTYPGAGYSAAPSLKGRGMQQPVQVIIQATVANGMDEVALAYRVADVLQRRGR